MSQDRPSRVPEITLDHLLSAVSNLTDVMIGMQGQLAELAEEFRKMVPARRVADFAAPPEQLEEDCPSRTWVAGDPEPPDRPDVYDKDDDVWRWFPDSDHHRAGWAMWVSPDNGWRLVAYRGWDAVSSLYGPLRARATTAGDA